MTEPSKEALAEARELRSAWLKQANDFDHGLGLTEFIALALDKARASEREACAQHLINEEMDNAEIYAAAIRNRARGHD